VGGGDVSLGGLDRGKDSSRVNEKCFAFLREDQPPCRPVQKLRPEAALQSCNDARYAGGGQSGFGTYGREGPQINRPNKNRNVRYRVHTHS
jgi:hypothetical protein